MSGIAISEESLRYVSRAALVELVGLEAAQRVVAVFGGHRVYVPEPSANGFATFAAKLDSPGVAKVLSFQFGGGQIILPLRLQSKNDEILSLREALSFGEIARRLKISERHVYRVLAQNRDGGR